MKKLMSLFCISGLLALTMFSACTSDKLSAPGEENTDPEIAGLEKEFGGYETDDEAVAFGETDMVDELGDDTEVVDTFASDPAVVDVINDDTTSQSFKAYYLRITWGLLEGDSSATEVVDWSGSAQVSKGTLAVMRRINFESNDKVVLPRTSRQLVEFVSMTKPYKDGLLFAIIDNDSTDSEGTFTFNAGSYTKTLRFSDLDSLDLLEPVGANGHEVSIITRSKDVTRFAGGFLEGQWVKTRPNGGQFRGRWINSLGTNAGYIKGIWGVSLRGNKVFKGKYINRNGEFRGLLAGQWQYASDNGHGSFHGRFVNSRRQTIGTIRGHFKTGRANDRRGYFHGRYHVTRVDNSEVDLARDVQTD